MVINVDKAYVDEVGALLTQQLGHSLKSGEIAMDDLPEIADEILNRIDKITDHPQLVSFLEGLALHWDFFSHIHLSEKAKAIERETDQKIQDIREMIEEHNTSQPAETVNTLVNQ